MHRYHFAPVTEATYLEARAIDAADAAAVAELESLTATPYGDPFADTAAARAGRPAAELVRETYTSTVPAAELRIHQRMIHRAGGVITRSAPVALGYVVTWCYREAVSA